MPPRKLLAIAGAGLVVAVAIVVTLVFSHSNDRVTVIAPPPPPASQPGAAPASAAPAIVAPFIGIPMPMPSAAPAPGGDDLPPLIGRPVEIPPTGPIGAPSPTDSDPPPLIGRPVPGPPAATGTQMPEPAPAQPTDGAPEPAPTPAPTGRATGAGPAATVAFVRHDEPREKAFNFLAPRGWRVAGGVFRVDPATTGGPGNSLEAKIDLTIASDAAGTIAMRRLPDMRYVDLRGQPAAGMFRQGGYCNGLVVWPKVSARQYLADVLFGSLHPQASEVRQVSVEPLAEVAKAFARHAQAQGVNFAYDAAMLTVEYTEGGVRYRERSVAVIEDLGALGAGMWGNRECGLFRAPADQFDRWAPAVSVVRNSVRINPTWLAGEIRGQIQRGAIAARTQADVERITREMLDHQQRTNSEINNDMFLNLTGQEEFVNPYTNQVERDTDHYRRRWVNESGEVVLSNDDNYDPNQDQVLNRTDFKPTPVRPRFPQ